MFTFDRIKPEIEEVIQEREVSKESLRNIFFYNLLELERLREHEQDLDSDINYEKDLFVLMGLGDRKEHTGQSIRKKEESTKKILPTLMKIILDEYLAKKIIDKWDELVLYNESELLHYLSGIIKYDQMLEKTVIHRNKDKGISLSE